MSKVDVGEIAPKVETSIIPMEGQTLEQYRTSYVTAVRVQKPRDIVEVEKRCLVEASLAGESCYYGWSAGESRVEGPSIELAMILARNWGNCAVECPPVIETSVAYYIPAAFIDLENGTTISRHFRQSKTWKVYGKLDEDRKADIRFQIGQSKSQRNVVIRALPSWLVDKCLEKAKEGVRQRIEQYIKKSGLPGARALALKEFTKYGVTQERIELKYSKKLSEWDIDILVLLKGDLQALQAKIEEPQDLFPIPGMQGKNDKPDGKNATERLTNELKEKVGNGQAGPTPSGPAIDEAKEAAIKEVLTLATDNEPVVRAKVLDRCTEEYLRGMGIEAIGVIKEEILEDIKKARTKQAKG